MRRRQKVGGYYEAIPPSIEFKTEERCKKLVILNTNNLDLFLTDFNTCPNQEKGKDYNEDYNVRIQALAEFFVENIGTQFHEYIATEIWDKLASEKYLDVLEDVLYRLKLQKELRVEILQIAKNKRSENALLGFYKTSPPKSPPKSPSRPKSSSASPKKASQSVRWNDFTVHSRLKDEAKALIPRVEEILKELEKETTEHYFWSNKMNQLKSIEKQRYKKENDDFIKLTTFEIEDFSLKDKPRGVKKIYTDKSESPRKTPSQPKYNFHPKKCELFCEEKEIEYFADFEREGLQAKEKDKDTFLIFISERMEQMGKYDNTKTDRAPTSLDPNLLITDTEKIGTIKSFDEKMMNPNEFFHNKTDVYQSLKESFRFRDDSKDVPESVICLYCPHVKFTPKGVYEYSDSDSDSDPYDEIPMDVDYAKRVTDAMTELLSKKEECVIHDCTWFDRYTRIRGEYDTEYSRITEKLWEGQYTDDEWMQIKKNREVLMYTDGLRLTELSENEIHNVNSEDMYINGYQVPSNNVRSHFTEIEKVVKDLMNLRGEFTDIADLLLKTLCFLHLTETGINEYHLARDGYVYSLMEEKETKNGRNGSKIERTAIHMKEIGRWIRIPKESSFLIDGFLVYEYDSFQQTIPTKIEDCKFFSFRTHLYYLHIGRRYNFFNYLGVDDKIVVRDREVGEWY